MVSIKSGEVIGGLMALRRLDEVKLDAVASLAVVKLNKFLASHWEDVDKVRQALVTENALRDTNQEPVPGSEPNTVEIDPAKKAEFEASMTALFEQTLEVEDKLLLSVGKHFKGVQIEPSVFLGLGDLITE